MSFFNTFDRISFVKIFSIAIFLSLLFGLPLTVLLVKQQTRINSRAYEKPEVMVADKPSPGPIPVQPPILGRVFPWVGKPGDIIWIQGKNFGNNPAVKSLKIGGIKVLEADIAGWEDDQIQAIIPQEAQQGGVVEIKVGQHPTVTSLPIVLYNKQAKIKLFKKGNLITAKNGGAIAKIKAWLGDENIPTELVEGQIKGSQTGITSVLDTAGKPILTILLYDSSGQILPYYVDPVEFGF